MIGLVCASGLCCAMGCCFGCFKALGRERQLTRARQQMTREQRAEAALKRATARAEAKEQKAMDKIALRQKRLARVAPEETYRVPVLPTFTPLGVMRPRKEEPEEEMYVEDMWTPRSGEDNDEWEDRWDEWPGDAAY